MHQTHLSSFIHVCYFTRLLYPSYVRVVFFCELITSESEAENSRIRFSFAHICTSNTFCCLFWTVTCPGCVRFAHGITNVILQMIPWQIHTSHQTHRENGIFLILSLCVCHPYFIFCVSYASFFNEAKFIFLQLAMFCANKYALSHNILTRNSFESCIKCSQVTMPSGSNTFTWIPFHSIHVCVWSRFYSANVSRAKIILKVHTINNIFTLRNKVSYVMHNSC